MKHTAFSLDVPSGSSGRLAAGWLLLALSSLAGSGLVVVLIVLARTPAIYEWIPWAGSFKTALVIHVVLSTLVWFLSFGGFLATLCLPGSTRSGQAFLVLAATGAAAVMFSPFLGQDAPFLNNYVPVLDNHAFFLGLALFVGGFGLTALQRLKPPRVDQTTEGGRALRFGAQTALVLALASMVLLAWSYVAMPPELQALQTESHYEILFWSAGHLLQFTHIQFLMLAWLWLTTVVAGGVPLGTKQATGLFLLGVLPVVLITGLLHGTMEIDSLAFRLAFTTLMTYGGLILLPVGLLVLWALMGMPNPVARRTPAYRALIFSLFFTAVGGMLGFMIQGVNVTIPAHYHGSIVGVTLAYMGIVYHSMPSLHFRAISPLWANRQLALYGVGSFLHIVGLAWSGGHGVQRKTSGAAQGLETLAAKMPMWIMGLGGMLAIIGGVLFLVLALRALKQGPSGTTPCLP